MIFDETTPIAALTVGDLKELLRELKLDRSSASVKPNQSNGKRYVYGLKGIQSLFNCSHLTAQRYKDTFLAPAVMQQGRKIVIDVEQAVELFKTHKDGNNG